MIGIIGGMGVYAGTDLVDKISAATLATSDQEFLPVALLSYPDIPDRSAFALGSESGPNPGIVVGLLVDKLVQLDCRVCGIACNTFHVESIFQHVAQRTDIRILSIVEETIKQLAANRADVGRVAVLGTRGTMRLGLYENALTLADVEQVQLSDAGVELVSHAIRVVPGGLKVQALVPSDDAIDSVIGAVDEAIELGASTVILGCTELPFILRSERARALLRGRKVSLVDPGTLLARALIVTVAPAKLLPGKWAVDLG